MRKDTRIVFTIPPGKVVPVLEWCYENFGPKHRKRWGHNNRLKYGYDRPIDFYINKKEDAMAFKLRWM